MSVPTSTDTIPYSPSLGARSERGAILLLMMLVIVVLMVVVVQMQLTSMADGSIAQNQLREFRFEFAAKGAYENARALLITDLRDEQLDAQAGAGGEGGEGGEEGEGDSGGGNFGGAGGAGGAGGEEQDPPNDTMKDNWAEPGQANQQMGDVDVRTLIVDEDRKFNLLSIVARDEAFREVSRDRAIRLLDTFREGTEFDVSYGDASEIVDALTDWFKGKRDSGFPSPPPQIVKEDGASRFEDTEERFADDAEEPIHYPLSFDELMMIDDVDESLLYGQFDDGKFVPGLCDVATIYSNLAFDAQAHQVAKGPVEEDAAGGNVAQPNSGGSSGSGGSGGSGGGNFQNPFGSGAGGGGGGNDESGGDSSKGNEEEPEGPPTDQAGQMIATETNQGRININTTPLAVMRVMVAEDEIPYSVLEKIDEFRRTALDEELLEQARRRGYGSDGEGDSGDDEKDKESTGFGNEDEEDPEALKDDFTFHKPDEVFEKVQDFFDTNFELPEEARLSFQNSIDVKSHVFTIYVQLRDRKNASGGSPFGTTGEAPPDAIYRAVVWRRQEGEGFMIVPILPLHPWTGSLPPETEDYRKEFPFGF